MIAQDLRAELQAALAARKSYQIPIDPTIQVDPNTSLGASFIRYRSLIMECPSAALEILAGLPLATPVFGEAVAVEAMCLDYPAASAHFREEGLKLLHSPQRFSYILKQALLSGSIPNAYELCRASLSLDRHHVTDREISALLLSEVGKLVADPANNPTDQDYLNVLFQMEVRSPLRKVASAESQKTRH